MLPRFPSRSSADAGWIWDIKKYALHDGPGIRTTVFFKGCPLSCLWCCNPESQRFGPECVWIGERCLSCNVCLDVCPHHAVSVDQERRRHVDPASCDYCGVCAARCPGESMNMIGRLVHIDAVLEEVTRDSAFYVRSGGGITLSGGEPLAQAEFAGELLRRYKQVEFGASAAIETAGAVEWDAFGFVLPYTDVFFFDIKHMESEKHRRFTGAGNERILDNARRLSAEGAPIIVRLPLVPGYNDSEDNIRATAGFAKTLAGVDQIDLLPYHRLGEPKYPRLHRDYALGGTVTPGADRLAAVRVLIESCGLRVRIRG